ncbi:MAG TPA: hypothetical protein DCE41_26175 [Cytophagales bacterium]|nr:hypothetical protein [Cytophagales bacterium]HAA22428.1 hypothetical protein [Cytophagales bacterium]HAP62307.1 hypothetical protein [Cytophagales bacterium]
MSEAPNQEAKSTNQGVHYIPMVQEYTFSQTGNIFISISKGTTDAARSEFARVCSEVAVFFASMTKAIHSVTNPNTGKPYTLYNYNALRKVINSSGMFVPLQEQDFTFTSTENSQDLAAELMQSILDIELAPQDLPKATATVQAMVQEEKSELQALGAKDLKTGTSTRSANIVFKCECLLGYPMVTVILARFRPQEGEEEVEEAKEGGLAETAEKVIRRILKQSLLMSLLLPEPKNDAPDKQQERTWEFTKETFLFVTPKYFKEYVGDLNLAQSSQYQQYITSLTRRIKAELEPEES